MRDRNSYHPHHEFPHVPSELVDRLFDAAVIGGGPAGLAAGIWLGRYLRSAVVIDAGEPRNWETSGIHGFLGSENLRPATLRAKGREECQRYNTLTIEDRVLRARQRGDGLFELETEDTHRVLARRVLIAIGVQDNWPDIPGLEECYGRTIHTCPHCDGYESRDTRTAVLGAGPKAASVALALRTWTDDLVIVTNGEQPDFGLVYGPRVVDSKIRIVTEPVERLESQERRLESIEFENGDSLAADHMFIAMGQHASDDIGEQLGCERDDIGLIRVNEQQRTSVPNVFAAGDCTPGVQLAMRAACGGMAAAFAIHRSLKED